MEELRSVELRNGELRSVRVKGRGARDAGYAELTIRVCLDDEFLGNVRLLMALQEVGQAVAVKIEESRARLDG